jgi:homogentisate 1,2-dioxygenase
VVPDAHVHQLADANPIAPDGNAISGRRLLMFNADLDVSVCKPTEARDGIHRNGEGDEVVYVHRGAACRTRPSAACPFRERDYVVIPRVQIS